MANRREQPGQSLPPCSTLLAGFVQCRNQPCSALLPSVDELLRHERACSYAMAYRPVQFPVQPHRLDTSHFSPPHSAQPDTDTDDSGSMTFTPNTSRAPSISGPSERRRSGVIRTVARHLSRRGSSPPESDPLHGEPKKLKKQEKEKQNRGQLGSVLFRTEDYLSQYIGWERREQSGGNGNGAGLQANKNTLMRGTEALLYYLVDKEFKEGLHNGDLEERRARMRSYMDAGLDRSPYEGTFLDPGDEELCTHSDTKSKECSVHGHPDWRQCRREAATMRFQRNLKAYCRKMFGDAY